MKHTMKIMIPFLMIAGLLTGCGTQQENTANSQPKAAASSGTVKEIAQTGMSTAVPDDYLQPIEQAGTVTQITYESKDFVRDESDITKREPANLQNRLLKRQFISDVPEIDSRLSFGSTMKDGFSGGGETGSLVMGKRPELFSAYLMTSSKWDGDLEVLANAHTPVYMAIGEDDSYYGSGYLKQAYSELYALYEAQGLSADEISELLVLDVK